MHNNVGLVVVIPTSPSSSKTESGCKRYHRFRKPVFLLARLPVDRMTHQPVRCLVRSAGWVTGLLGLCRTKCQLLPGHSRNLPVASRRHSRFLPDWPGATPGGTGSPTRLPGAPSGAPAFPPGRPKTVRFAQRLVLLLNYKRPFFPLGCISSFSPTPPLLLFEELASPLDSPHDSCSFLRDLREEI